MFAYRDRDSPGEEEARREREARKPFWKQRRPPAPVKEGKPAAFYVPVEYDLAGLPSNWRWPTAYFLNQIHWGNACWRADRFGYVRLKHRYLNRVIPDGMIRPIRKRLEADGVIEVDPELQPNCSFGHKLTDRYRRTHRIECDDLKLNKRIWRLLQEDERDLLPVHRHLKAKMDLLEVDLERARAIIAGLRPRSGSGKTAKAHRLDLLDHCLRLANRDGWFVVDKFGRLHTPLTSLVRELRCCLSVGGKPLVEIDLANSQPLVLAMLAREFLRFRVARKRLLEHDFDAESGRRAAGGGRPVKEETAPAASGTAIPDDLARCIRACEAGRFYESLMTPEERARGKRYRERFKERVFTAFFGQTRTRGRFPNVVKLRLGRLYPSVAGVLRKLKRKDYRRSSWLLQHYEARLFIEAICQRLMREMPEAALYTIHDSILCLPEHVGHVRAVILDEFGRRGVRPTLNLKPPLNLKEDRDGHQPCGR
jgi:hypothetical protein